MRTAVLLAFSLTLSAFGAPVPKALKKPTDAALLEGKWVSVTVDIGEGPQRYDGVVITFKNGAMTQEWKGSRTTGRVAIDETTMPKQLDVSFPSEKPWEHIYQLDGDTLTVCRGRTKNGRVIEFKGGGTTPCLALTRVKE